jgi:hypothetical protein
LESYRAAGLSADDLAGPRFYRLRTLRRLIDSRRLTGDLRWREAPVAAPADASALTS